MDELKRHWPLEEVSPSVGPESTEKSQSITNMQQVSLKSQPIYCNKSEHITRPDDAATDKSVTPPGSVQGRTRRKGNGGYTHLKRLHPQGAQEAARATASIQQNLPSNKKGDENHWIPANNDLGMSGPLMSRVINPQSHTLTW